MKKINSVEELNKLLGKNIKNDLDDKLENNLENNLEDQLKKVNNRLKEEIEDNSISSNYNGCKGGFTITKEIEEFDSLKTKVFKYISYKKRTENEIRQKFSDCNQDMLEDVIEYFKEQNYINDEDYIDRSIREFFKLKNLSIKEITYKLSAKGVDKKALDNYVLANKETLLEYEINSAKKLILKKKDKMEIQDLKQYLFKKGYMRREYFYCIRGT